MEEESGWKVGTTARWLEGIAAKHDGLIVQELFDGRRTDSLELSSDFQMCVAANPALLHKKKKCSNIGSNSYCFSLGHNIDFLTWFIHIK